MANIQVIKEMMVQRGFQKYKFRETYFIGKNNHEEYIYIKIFNSKLELNIVREFLSTKFTISSDGIITIKNTSKTVVQLVIICKNFQNLHIKEFKELSKNIQLIKEDFFKINITKIVPKHEKVDRSYLSSIKGLPSIKEDDPNCIFYNFIVGDIIRVIRSNGDIIYRQVKKA